MIPLFWLSCVSGEAGFQPETLHITPDAARWDRILSLGPLPDLPEDPTNAWADSEEAARFGQQLFFDPRLSPSGEVACSSCHDPEHRFGDRTVLSEGVSTGQRHSPVLLNSAYQRWMFWDGRADSLWAQAIQPLESPDEQGSDRAWITRLLLQDPVLLEQYESLFGVLDLQLEELPVHARPVPEDPSDPSHQAWAALSPQVQDQLTQVLVHVAKAIAAYERRLVTAPSRLDTFIEGYLEEDEDKIAVLTASEQRGLLLFVSDNPINPFFRGGSDESGAECYACHSGPLQSDLEFHNLGLGSRAELDDQDLGRYEGLSLVSEDEFSGTGRWSDAPDHEVNDKLRYLVEPGSEHLGQFKTPSLRAALGSPPFMHGGHFETIEELIRFYAELSEFPVLGHRDEQLYPLLDLSESDLEDLIALMDAMQGGDPDPALLGPPG